MEGAELVFRIMYSSQTDHHHHIAALLTGVVG
jgi:hypothetical protein